MNVLPRTPFPFSSANVCNMTSSLRVATLVFHNVSVLRAISIAICYSQQRQEKLLNVLVCCTSVNCNTPPTGDNPHVMRWLAG